MAGEPDGPLSEIAPEQFFAVDIRAARIVSVEPFPKARKPAWKVQVDLGPLGRKWASAQVTNYSAAELVGTLVVCVCNFPPRNIAGFQSEVLILGAPDKDGNVILLSPRKATDGSDLVAPGTRIF